MRVADALQRACAALDAAEASRVVAAALGRETAWLIAYGDDALDDDAARRVNEYVARRAAGEPLAYLTGVAGFYGRTFFVTNDVLIPRPETEHLIDDAVATLREGAAPRVVDIGTGSGALAVTLALELPNADVSATDVSQAAISVARRNAESLGARVHFVHAAFITNVDLPLDAVVANLPYVPTAQIAAAPDPVSFEPRLALDGGADGLDLYRTLLSQLPPALNPGALVLLEAAPPTMEGLVALARAAFPEASIRVQKDYAGLERYVRVKLRS